MSRTTQIFERLAEAQKENKKVESLKEELERFKNECNKSFLVINECNNKLNMIQDILKSKAAQEDLQSINLKLHNQFEELKKSLNVEQDIKKQIEDLKKQFLDVNEYEKDIDNIQLCLEKYVLTNDSKQNNDDERLKALETRMRYFEDLKEVTPRVPAIAVQKDNNIRVAMSNKISSNIRAAKST
jgi:hypothetical protein